MPEPFDDYLQALRSAADLYRTDVVASRIAAVSATISFLRAMNVESSLRTPMLNVLGQLEDEQQGRTGNTMATMAAANMGAAAAVITLAMRAGYAPEDAATMIARQAGLGRATITETRPWEQLLQFRKNLMSRKRPADAARVYTMMLQQASKSGVSRDEALHLGLQLLRERVRGQPKAS